MNENGSSRRRLSQMCRCCSRCRSKRRRLCKHTLCRAQDFRRAPCGSSSLSTSCRCRKFERAVEAAVVFCKGHYFNIAAAFLGRVPADAASCFGVAVDNNADALYRSVCALLRHGGGGGDYHAGEQAKRHDRADYPHQFFVHRIFLRNFGIVILHPIRTKVKRVSVCFLWIIYNLFFINICGQPSSTSWTPVSL